jgi:hypothetical protein
MGLAVTSCLEAAAHLKGLTPPKTQMTQNTQKT